MAWWRHLRADLARPEVATSRDEFAFHLVAPVVIVAAAQVTDPAPPGTLGLLVPAAVAFALRPMVPRFPAELFALAVVVPVVAAVSRRGDVEISLLLCVCMVLYISWSLRSVARAVVITVVSATAPWFVATALVPEDDINWYPWLIATVFMFILGRTLSRQRDLIAELEAARQALADEAVADERRRIARELHDLTGHTLAAMVLHVTGARHVLRRDLEEAETALRDAEAVGRSSLEQVRATVAALRTEEKGTDPVLPGPADLADLVEGYRRAGLAIKADLAPPVQSMEGPVAIALVRIAREALTNVARHAPRNRVHVRTSVSDREVRLRVADHGRPGVPPDPQQPHFGLIGMTERARALGGDLQAGATDDGWRVVATLPLANARAEPVTR